MSDEARGSRVVLVVTGMSGAGKTVTLKALEDAGYEAIDNPPLSLIETLATGAAAPSRPLALGIDVRTRDFDVGRLLAVVDRLEGATGTECSVLFLDCDEEVALRRYTETRRRHPLAGRVSPREGIREERRLLAPLKSRADRVLDTSLMTPHELRRIAQSELGIERRVGMTVFVSSFSYRKGPPREADIVLDVRFLANPHWIETLKPLSGLEPAVAEYVAQDSAFGPFVDRLQALLIHVLPRYEREGKTYLNIAFGCTGGRHRSVVVAELIARWLINEGWSVSTSHRDIADADAEATSSREARSS